MKSFRSNRVGALIQHELAELIRTEIPISTGAVITVTSVQVSTDAKYADILVSIIGDEKAKSKALERLKSNASRMRYILSGKIKLRHSPELRFKFDKTAEEAQRIDQILNDSGIDFTEGED